MSFLHFIYLQASELVLMVGPTLQGVKLNFPSSMHSSISVCPPTPCTEALLALGNFTISLKAISCWHSNIGDRRMLMLNVVFLLLYSMKCCVWLNSNSEIWLKSCFFFWCYLLLCVLWEGSVCTIKKILSIDITSQCCSLMLFLHHTALNVFFSP